ncbi:MAG TPA: type II toxin-antitoxin system VapC family toxin [Methylomirabilota bacterium]
MTHLDTSFLVDLLRESSRHVSGPATSLLDTLEGEEVRVGVHVVCELLAGAELSRQPGVERQRVRQLCMSLQVVYPDERFPTVYGRLLGDLERRRQRVSTMDLLIATAALVDEAGLVTRNAKDFSRIPGLELVTY